MVRKKPPAITHSVRIPVGISETVQTDADLKAGGNFSEMLITIIQFYYNIQNPKAKSSTKRTKK